MHVRAVAAYRKCIVLRALMPASVLQSCNIPPVYDVLITDYRRTTFVSKVEAGMLMASPCHIAAAVFGQQCLLRQQLTHSV
jgi:hypothetical protein